MAIYAIPRQRLIDRRSAAAAGLAIAIFISGLGLGAIIATNAGIGSTNAAIVSSNAPVIATARDLDRDLTVVSLPVVSLPRDRSWETSVGASNSAAGTSFDVAHHVGQSVPQSLQSGAAIDAVRYQRRAEFGVGGP